jgi:TPR repeat protein
MKTRVAALVCCLAPGFGLVAQPAAGTGSPAGSEWQLVLEQKHFLHCLGFVYDPALWFSYKGSLYFTPRNEAQAQELAGMKAVRAKYVALTNRQARCELAARAIAESGLDSQWQKKLILPYSETNQNLTPTLPRPIRILARYEVIQLLPEGDALIAGEGATNFVMDFGRAADDAFRTNATLLKEGERTLTTGSGARQTFEAFTDAGLSKEETAVLQKVSAMFEQKSAVVDPGVPTEQAKEEFEGYLVRAKDSSPYMEYMLAKCYLEGLGTPKDKGLGLEWMKRAAKSGSGDAKTYLEKAQSEAR